MHCTGVNKGGVVLVVVVVVMVVALVVVVVGVVVVVISVVMVGKRGTTTINFNTLCGGCENCCKCGNSDCSRIAILRYILGWACCGASGGGAVCLGVRAFQSCHGGCQLSWVVRVGFYIWSSCSRSC